MKIKYDSHLVKRKNNFPKTKQLTTSSFYTNKLLKTKSHSSTPNFKTEIKQRNNLTIKENKKPNINIKKVKKPILYDLDYLKSDLLTFRSEVQKRKNEFIRLKIKYGKLLIDNINNKTLIANIVGIPTNQLFNRKELIMKFNNCTLNQEQRQSLQFAYETLKLKLELNSKKKLLSDNVMYLSTLIQNSKMSIVSYLQSEYFIKCEQQRSLVKILAKLFKKYDEYKTEIADMESRLKMQNIKCENLFEKEYQDVDHINKMVDEKSSLVKQINGLKDKIIKHKKNYSYKEKVIQEKIKNNSYDEQQLQLLKNYSYDFSGEQIEMFQLRKSNEEIENLLKNYTEEIKALKEELLALQYKLNRYEEEKPKLIFKVNESKKIIEKIELLEKELEILKKKKEEKKEIYNKNVEEFNEIKTQVNKSNMKYSKKIKENMNIKKELKKRVQELQKKISNNTNKNNLLKSKINQGQNEYKKLDQNIKELKNHIENLDLNYETMEKKREEERLKEGNRKEKERKSELDNLEKEKQKLNNDNQIIENENNVLQEEIDGFDNELINYEKIEKQLKISIGKINSIIYNELLDK